MAPVPVTAVRAAAIAAAAVTALAAPPAARGDDSVDFTTTLFQEKREGAKGLTVFHPQVDLGVDLGDVVTLSGGYSADVVSGATAAVYSVDAVSSATEFSDTRHEARLGLGLRGRRSALSVSGSAGVERDYASIILTVGATIDLPGKNTSLALSYSHNFDQVCDRDNAMATPLARRALTGFDVCDKDLLFGVDRPGETVWHDLSIDSTQATLTQNLSPTLVAQLGLFGSVLHGFQSSPYRRVRVFATEPQEAVPPVRGRLAVSARLNKFLPGLRAAVGFSARGYSDTWGVNSATLEMTYSQYLGRALLFRARLRGYQQAEATFFKDAFFYQTEGSANAYFTGDRELGALRHVLAGGKLSYLAVGEGGRQVWGLFDEVDLSLKGELLFFEELPVGAVEANPAGIERQFLSGGSFFDGLVLQLGLALRY